LQSQHYSFVVRVWLEGTYSEQETAMWRGSIERVGSDGRMYFSDFDGITRYIQTQIGVQKPPPPTGWRLGLEHIKNGVQKLWNRLLHQNG
jgi:hypothetical protein